MGKYKIGVDSRKWLIVKAKHHWLIMPPLSGPHFRHNKKWKFRTGAEAFAHFRSIK